MDMITMLKSMFGGVKVKKEVDAVPTVTKGSMIWTPSYFNNTYHYGTKDYLNLNVATVNACCRLRAEAVASAEPRLYDPSGVAVTSHWFLDMLLGGNDYMSYSEMMQLSVNYLDLIGEVFWYSDGVENGKPRAFYPLMGGDYMEIKTSSGSGDIEYYIYRGVNGKEVKYSKDRIMSFRYPNPQNPMRGLPLAAGADYSIQAMIEMHKSRLALLHNNSLPPFGLTSDDGIPANILDNIRNQFEDRHKGADKSGNVAVLPFGLKPVEFPAKHADLMYLSPMGESRIEVCEVFRVPAAMLGTLENYNKSNLDGATVMFMNHTIKPVVQIFDDGLTRQKLPAVGLKGWKIKSHVPVPRDDEVFAKTLNTLILSGLMKPNEGRAELNLPPDKAGDNYFVPVNVMRVDPDGERLDISYTDVDAMAVTPTEQQAQKDKVENPEKTINEVLYTVRKNHEKMINFEKVSENLQKGKFFSILKYRGSLSSVIAKSIELYVNAVLIEAREHDYGIDKINDKLKKFMTEIMYDN